MIIPRDFQTQLARMHRQMKALIVAIIGTYTVFIWTLADHELIATLVSGVATFVLAFLIDRLFHQAERTIDQAERAAGLYH